ncbi:triple tyrosine motif-containing protein [Fulvivirga sp.]|uniref:triple tyrosine motif-containing protein n=1 Tax=Fulvivirga sp. TaxID=1931237 RepID=UPI0032ED080F
MHPSGWLRSVVFIFILTFSGSLVFGQKGDFFLTHYSHQSEALDNINFDIAQDEKGVICIANRAGILRFDGRNWEHINTPSAAFSLTYNATDKTIYIGGYDGLGKLVRNKENSFVYESLIDSTQHIGEIFSVVIRGDLLYGLSNSAIVKYNLKTKKTSSIISKYSGELYKLFELGEDIYVSTEKSGLQKVGESSLEETMSKKFDRINVEFIAKHPEKEQYLFGLLDNTLKLYNGSNVVNLDIKDDDAYLQNSEITDGIWINDSLSAVATLKGGVIFINHRRKTIEQIVNYQSGLPDNEIFAFAEDSNGGIWVAHSAGFTRISPGLPFRNFNKFEGLEGNILSVINHNDSLYVGTSMGLYFLEKVQDYEDIVYKEQQVITTTKSVPEAEKPKRKKGLFGFLKSNKEEEPTTNTVTTSRTVTRNKVRQELKSISYRYKKVEGLNSKVFHFMATEDKLFCAGLDGLYQIKNTEAIVITRDPIHTFSIAKKNQKVFAATYADELKVFDINTNERVMADVLSDFRDHIQHIFEDDNGLIWISSTDEIYFLELDGEDIIGSEHYPITNPFYFNTFGGVKDEMVYFINESGTFSIDPEKNTVNKIDDISAKKYLTGSNGEVWIYDGENWTKIAESNSSKKLNLLSVFKNINYISSDDKDDYWVVTENDELYKLTDSNDKIISPYELYLKRIKTPLESLLPYDKMKFDQENSSLLFEFAQPEFSGILDIKYQYKLEGLNKDWSDWSGNYNIVNFSYLPEGNYTLKMRSKDILGKVSEIEPISFEIVPPYWKRPWFYALEFTVLALLLFITVRLKKLGFKYRLVSRLLALITLIIIIEFIQTIAENEFASQSTPVIDFLIQITIAIIVLPIESVIRKFIFKEKNVQILDFIQIKNKKDK